MVALLKNSFPWLVFVLGIVLTVQDQYIGPFILLTFIASIPHWQRPTLTKDLLPAILFIAYFGIYLVGMTYSNDMVYGWENITSRLSFIIFPLMLLFSYRSWDSRIVELGKNGIIVGVAISLALTYGRAAICYVNGGDICFRADQFGWNMHATYLSLIYIISLLFLFEKKSTGRTLLLKIVYAMVVLSAVYLMRSLSTLLVLALLIGLIYIYVVVNKRKWWALIMIPIMVIGGFITIKQLPQLNYDLEKTIRIAGEYINDRQQFLKDNNNHTESNTVRLIVWGFSMDVITEHPFGVGTGDVRDELFKKYTENSFWYYAEKKLNPHNQFLQTGVAIGWPGIIILFFLILLPLLWRSTWKSYVYPSFVIAIFITCLFESYLERQAGVISFAFLSVLLAADQILRNRMASNSLR